MAADVKTPVYSEKELQQRDMDKLRLADKYGISITIHEPYCPKCEIFGCEENYTHVLFSKIYTFGICLCKTHHAILMIAGLKNDDYFRKFV